MDGADEFGLGGLVGVYREDACPGTDVVNGVEISGVHVAWSTRDLGIQRSRSVYCGI